jgi:hypothetical protein
LASLSTFQQVCFHFFIFLHNYVQFWSWDEY